MRKRLFKWHSYLALFAMIPVLIISITGSILVFKVEIDSMLRPHHMVVALGHGESQAQSSIQTKQSRLSLDTLMQAVSTRYPEYILSGWELFGTQANGALASEATEKADLGHNNTPQLLNQRSDTAYAIKRHTDTWYKIYINQYTGEVLSEPKHMQHYITDWLLELHYAFLLHFSGTVIGAIFGLILLFLGISGIVLYRGFWRKIFTLRWQGATRTLLSDWHKLVGILSSPVLIIIAFTGVYWNISIVLHEVIEHGFEEEHPAITQAYHSSDISFEALHAQTKTEISSFRATYLAIPNEPNMNITFFGEVDTANPLLSQYASSVTFDHTSGNLLNVSDIRNASFVMKFDDSTRKLHFGYFAGIWSKVLWCIIGLSPVILAILGFMMFRMRQNPQKGRQRVVRNRSLKA